MRRASHSPATTLMVVCPSHRDRRELVRLAGTRGYELVFHDYASIELEEMVAPAQRFKPTRPVLEEVERIVAAAAAAAVAGVVSTDDYPGSTLAAIVAQRLGLRGTPVAADLVCQHKYYSRLIQQDAQPEVVPAFELLMDGVPPNLSYPFFIKPVKSFFSVGAYEVSSPEEVRALTALATLPAAFFEPLDSLLGRYTSMRLGPSVVLGEGLLSGRQATFEGYAFEGQVHPLGVVDSIMHEGTLAFKRFEYPSALPDAVKSRMAAIAERVMHATGFVHGMFNIEFCYDARHDKLGIVEINPRMASQFADLYEKVDGLNSYEILLDLALGIAPNVERGKGRHANAASCVLRRFDDARVIATPSVGDLRRIQQIYPDARIEVLANAGENLSEQLQDSCSFRYCIISIGGCSGEDSVAAGQWCADRLGFKFGKPAGYEEPWFDDTFVEGSEPAVPQLLRPPRNRGWHAPSRQARGRPPVA